MITIHLLGDSIVNAYGKDEENFIGGWGDHLGSFLDACKVQIKCYAQGGRSSRSFLNEGRFIDTGKFTSTEWPYGLGPAYPNIKEGDFVFLQFGHNDDDSKGRTTLLDRMVPLGKANAEGIYPTVVPEESMKTATSTIDAELIEMMRQSQMSQEEIEENIKKNEEVLQGYGDTYYAYNCGATYKGFLKFYIEAVRAKGAYPVLVTSASRRTLKDGIITQEAGHHGGRDAFGDFPYIRAVHQLGSEEGVPVLELFEGSKALYEQLGEEDSSYLQSIVDENGLTMGEARYGRPKKWVEDYDDIRSQNHFARLDNTHQNRIGAFLFAAIVSKEVYNKVPNLSKHVLGRSTKKVAYPQKLNNRVEEIEQFIKK